MKKKIEDIAMAQVPENNQVAEENLESRRRFLKTSVISAALISTPTVLTVTSKPVWAANCTESGQLSGNLSNGLDDCSGEGCSPGYWKNHDNWHRNYPRTAYFSDVFGINPFPPGTDPTLGCVIQSYCDPEPVEPLIEVLGFHAVAALQNAATPVKFDWDVTTVINEVYYACSNYISTGEKSYLETCKDKLDTLNNQGCPY